jgi:hypothetical protein
VSNAQGLRFIPAVRSPHRRAVSPATRHYRRDASDAVAGAGNAAMGDVATDAESGVNHRVQKTPAPGVTGI